MHDTQVFVVRIYRSHDAGRQAASGVLETVRSGRAQPFRSLEELKRILDAELRMTKRRGNARALSSGRAAASSSRGNTRRSS
jgi:hypothetical protein